MAEDSPLDNPVQFWVIFLAILATILFVGWKQPLRYRFMSKEAIFALEHPPTPTPPPATPRPNWMYDPNRKTPLNRETFHQNSNVYHSNPVFQQSGTPYPTRLNQ